MSTRLEPGATTADSDTDKVRAQGGQGETPKRDGRFQRENYTDTPKKDSATATKETPKRMEAYFGFEGLRVK